MLIHNATFMVRKEMESALTGWLKDRLDGLDLGRGRSPRLSVMREAAGVPQDEAEATSVAFQVEFDMIDDARDWAKGPFARLADDFTLAYAPDAIVFSSIFETV